jgi:hypothetical protein
MFNSSCVITCLHSYRSTLHNSDRFTLQLWSMFDYFGSQVCGIVVVPHYHSIVITKSDPEWTILGKYELLNAGFQSSDAEGISSQGL